MGTDHGYWHGFRLIRVASGRVTTDTVPIFTKDGIRLEGPDRVNAARQGQYEAFGRQPVFNDPAKVPNLELRDPDPTRPDQRRGHRRVREGRRLDFVPMMLLVLGGLAMNGTLPRPRRRALVLVCVAAGAGVVGMAGMSLAQQSEPTTTPLASLPVPARIFTTSDALVLAPVPGKRDDPRRNARTQTEGGLFAGRCPGRRASRMTSGFETTTRRVLVPSKRRRGSPAGCAP